MSDTHYYLGREHQQELLRQAEAERAIRSVTEDEVNGVVKSKPSIIAWIGRHVNEDTSQKLATVRARS